MTSTDSFKDAKKKSFHPVDVTGNANISKVRIMKESDGRYMVPDIVKSVDCVPKLIKDNIWTMSLMTKHGLTILNQYGKLETKQCRRPVVAKTKHKKISYFSREKLGCLIVRSKVLQVGITEMLYKKVDI